MLSNNNQYLRPEYLSPLPTTLDSKKSPLALLAQTCSQIGSDLPVGKISSDKKKPSVDNRDKNSPLSVGSVEKNTPKLCEYSKNRDVSDDSSKSTHQNHYSSSHSSNSSSSNSSSSSNNNNNLHKKTSPACFNDRTTPSNDVDRRTKSSSPRDIDKLHSIPPEVPSSVATSSSTAMLKPLGNPHATGDSLYKDTPLGTYKHAATAGGYPVLPPAGSHLHFPGFGYPNMDPLTSLGSYASALNTVKSMPPPVSFGLPGYSALHYGRMKSPLTNDSVLPMSVCRDPYCTGCPGNFMGLASGAQTVCPAGCVQCDHQKIPIFPNHFFMNPNAAATAAANAAAATQAAAAAAGVVPSSSSSSNVSISPNSATHGQRPYVCNWIVGDNYCGKRFPSSEELLQHLRTHTNVSNAENAAAASASLLQSSHPAFSHPLLGNSGIGRTYPTPPLSPLSAARYHPYSKVAGTPSAAAAAAAAAAASALSASGLNFPGLLGVPLATSTSSSYPPLLHPGLAPYYSHLSLYGPRLGAAATLPP